MSEYTEMRDYGFASVESSANIKMVAEKALESWQNFYKLPSEVKSIFVRAGNGARYQPRLMEEGRQDGEEAFCIPRSELGRLRTIAPTNHTCSEFFQDSEVMLGELREFIVDFAIQIEGRGGAYLSGLTDEVRQGIDAWSLRFSRYPPAQTTERIIGPPTVDQYGLTIHVITTTSGIRYWDESRNSWVGMSVEPEKMVIVAGLQMQYRSHCEIIALPYLTESNEVSAEEGRDSIVCFIPLVNTPKFDEAQYPMLRRKSVGFNCSMKFENFKKLFT